MSRAPRSRPAPRRPRLAVAAALAAVLTLSIVPACGAAHRAGPTADAAASARGLQLGFMDEGVLGLRDPAQIAVALQRAREAGATLWRADLNWREVARTRPPTDAEAADPNWSGYQWASTDRMVKAITAAGLDPVLVVVSAPAWAEGPGRPSEQVAPAGTWRPSETALQAFATALARRYSGSFPDPAGGTLPRVRYWQGWNEPNLTDFLTPQWTRTKKGFKPASPGIYRSLQNAFYRGIKAAVPSDTVISAATAPFGDPNRGDRRMPPVRFWRKLLCVKGSARPKTTKCGEQVSFDAYAHNPYPIGPPRRRARNADDVVVPDLGKITRLVRVAGRAGTIQPRGSKALWATEIAWDTRPDPNGLSLDTQAQYLEGALNVLYDSGARVVLWYKLRDEAPVPTYDTTYQSGIYLRGSSPADDEAKPSLTAFRFPFTAYRSKGVARLWGIAPQAGPVVVQVRRGTQWVDAARLRAGSSRVFTGRLRVGRGTRLRAVSGTNTSLTWRSF